jgi:hypothetical protein
MLVTHQTSRRLDHIQRWCSVYRRPCTNISHIQVLVKPFFPNPTHKTKNWWLPGDSKPLGLIIMIDQSETRSSCQNIFITLFSGKQVLRLVVVPFTRSVTCTKMLGQNHFCWAKLAHFDFFFIQFWFAGFTYWAPAVEFLLFGVKWAGIIYIYTLSMK